MHAADRFGSHWTVRALMFAAVWLILSGGAGGSWLIGIPAVAFATWTSGRIADSGDWPISATGLLRFVVFFARESVRGGIDVAGRTLRPAMRISPGFIDYPVRLPAGRPRVLFANCVSLLPGTLTAELRDDRFVIHLLDTGTAALDDLDALERHVRALFKLPSETQGA